MFFGISFHELIIIIVVAIVVLKPEDIPSTITKVKKAIISLKNFATLAKSQVKEITDEIMTDVDINNDLIDKIYDVGEVLNLKHPEIKPKKEHEK
jgi:Sec-independent protein translocase protein TatA